MEIVERERGERKWSAGKERGLGGGEREYNVRLRPIDDVVSPSF